MAVAPDATATWSADPMAVAPDATAVAPSPYAAPAPGVLPSAGVLGVADAPVLDERGNIPAGAVGLLGALLITVGVFLPWISVAGTDVSGWTSSDDAKGLLVVAALATVVAALLVAGARGLLLRLVALGLGVVAVAVAAYDIVSAGRIDGVAVDLGAGLFVVVAGGVALTVAGLLTRHRRYR